MEKNNIETDVLIIGGGPAGLATAIHLADLIRRHHGLPEGTASARAQLPLSVILLEKANVMGDHALSGTVINPVSLRMLLPDCSDQDFPFEEPVRKDDILFFTGGGTIPLPFHPPYMGNKGNYIACLGKVVRWLSEIAQKKGIEIFSGVSGHELLWEDGKVLGVLTGASGLDKQGKRLVNYQPPTEIRAKITVFAEGARGHLVNKVIDRLGLAQEANPQVYSTGVKELWEVPDGNFEAGRVVHTMGFPLEFDQFGGGFIYGLTKNLVALGLVVGLDYKDPTFDPHHAFQIYKTHPFLKKILKGGKILRYGAKTIPEGGLFSLPQLYHDRILIVGDSAGFLAMPSLKGVHLAVESGMLAAQTAFEALKNEDASCQRLSLYEMLFKKSLLYKTLWPVRNFRQGFEKNLFLGMLQFGGQILTGGRGLALRGRLSLKEDCEHCLSLQDLGGKTFLVKWKDRLVFDKVLTFDKETDVFYSGTKHHEDQPSHIVVLDSQACAVCIEKHDAPCQRFCPAKVFEIIPDSQTGKRVLRLHPENCVHCKTCDIKDPMRNVIWQTPYGGDGPRYDNL